MNKNSNHFPLGAVKEELKRLVELGIITQKEYERNAVKTGKKVLEKNKEK